MVEIASGLSDRFIMITITIPVWSQCDALQVGLLLQWSGKIGLYGLYVY